METDKEVLNIEPWFAAQNAVGRCAKYYSSNI